MSHNKSEKNHSTDPPSEAQVPHPLLEQLGPDARTYCFWMLANRFREIGGMDNVIACFRLSPDFTMVITGGETCDSLPQADLDDLADYEGLQVTIHDDTGQVVGVDAYPALKPFKDIIYERYPDTHIGSEVPVETIMDMLTAAGALNVQTLLH